MSTTNHHTAKFGGVVVLARAHREKQKRESETLGDQVVQGSSFAGLVSYSPDLVPVCVCVSVSWLRVIYFFPASSPNPHATEL